MERRAIRPEDVLIVHLVSLAIYQIAGFILMAVFKQHNNAYIFLAYVIPQVVYIAVTVGYFLIAKVEFRPLPIRSQIKPLHYLFAFIVAIGLFFFALLPNTGIQKLFTIIGKAPSVVLPDLTKPVSCVLAVLFLCILPSIGEELVFRKVFCDAFACYGKVACILLSGVIFGLGHLNLAQTFHQIFLGWILAFIYVKTKNVTLTCLIHFINNFLALFLPRFTGRELWNNYTVLGISCAVGVLLLVGGLLYFVFKTPRLRNKAVESSDSVITAVYTEEGKVDVAKEEVMHRRKPSIYVIIYFALITVLWIVSAAVQ